jgi:nucleoid-associated protein YgaU
MTDYMVKSGDSLSIIAARELGDALRWPSIYLANKTAIDAAYAKALPTLRRYNQSRHRIHHPSDFIRLGQTLRLPA